MGTFLDEFIFFVPIKKLKMTCFSKSHKVVPFLFPSLILILTTVPRKLKKKGGKSVKYLIDKEDCSIVQFMFVVSDEN